MLKVPSSEREVIRNHIVEVGDNLWKIANQYSTTVSELKELNGLTSNDLRVGEVLIIP